MFSGFVSGVKEPLRNLMLFTELARNRHLKRKISSKYLQFNCEGFKKGLCKTLLDVYSWCWLINRFKSGKRPK